MDTHFRSTIYRNIFFPILVGLLLTFQTELTAQSVGKLNLEELSDYIDKAYQDWEIPGMAIVIIKDTQIVFSEGYGVRNSNSGEKVDTNTIFGIASNTKAMTATALAMLVDEGKISWDDKVRKYLPWFRLYNPYVSEETTIRDLLCHRVGLVTFSGDLLWYGSNYSREEVIRRARYLKPTYDFRSGYGYSNIMFITAGEIIPVVTGQSWDNFVKEKFFKPLGMNNTSTSISSFQGNNNIVTGHIKFEENQVPVPWINWDNMGPAGSVNSSVADMSKWIMLQLNRGTFNKNIFFSKTSSTEMWTVQNPFKVSDKSLEIFPSMHFSGYGLGWSLFDYHGRKITTHGGGMDGQISRVVLVPEENLGIVILTNSINSLPTYLMYEILDRYFGAEAKDWSSWGLMRYRSSQTKKEKQQEDDELNRVKNTLPSLPLEGYTGIYGGDLYGDAEVRIEDGHLVVFFIPTPMFEGDLFHWHYNTFQIKLRNTPGLPSGKVQFVLNMDGEVEEMKIDIPNPDFDFTELKFFKVK